MIPTTGYVLGNGPTLPVAQLHKLAGAFAVGVNRILISGFNPTALFFADMGIIDDESDRLKASPTLVLGAQEHRLAFAWEGVVWVPTQRQKWPGVPEPDRRVFKVRGNSAAAVALWMLALGVERVQMLGCGCSVVDGRSHFYGAHPCDITEQRYQNSRLNSLTTHIDALRANYPDRIVVSDDLPDDPVDDVVDQAALRLYLRGVVMGVL